MPNDNMCLVSELFGHKLQDKVYCKRTSKPFIRGNYYT